MKALIWIAHGSGRSQSNDAVNELVEQLTPKLSSKFDLILPAFLELAEPKILQQVQCAVEEGAKHIALFPYF